ncbi:MAG TPA: hypothetical protein VHB21_19215 [Minicystis sp.]|nr:hypothetical protein [Minicystis sp.]
MATPKNRLPECGLYRTTRALPGHEDKIKAGMLVYFHNHSDSGPLPSVLAPDHNVLNRWHFHGPAIEFRGLSWAETLEPLPTEGFYTLRRELSFEGGSWPKSTIVQLGYNPQADPILFIARVPGRLTENVLAFSDRGVGIPREQLNILEPAVTYAEPAEGHTADHGH